MHAGLTMGLVAVLSAACGVGELDDEFWRKGVREAHESLAGVGVDSVYVEFKGQAHGAREGFPKDLLFEFWTKHSVVDRR